MKEARTLRMRGLQMAKRVGPKGVKRYPTLFGISSKIFGLQLKGDRKDEYVIAECLGRSAPFR